MTTELSEIALSICFDGHALSDETGLSQPAKIAEPGQYPALLSPTLRFQTGTPDRHALRADPQLTSERLQTLMHKWTFKELQVEHEKIVLGLQYTIAERERMKALWRVVADFLRRDSGDRVPRIMDALLKTPSERFQDIFALLASGGKDQGFFVEFGACDGLVANNTVILEKEFGWKGILAEPAIFWHDRLRSNRQSKIDTRCVSSATGKELQFFQSEFPGNSSSDANHPYLGSVRESYTVGTVSLLDLLVENGAPDFIDFLSIDTEGHEMEILSAFDFNRYRFGFICVEQHEDVVPENDVRPLLEAAGYKMVFPRERGRPVPMQITGVDLFFVPEDHPWAGASGFA
jgi:FkbM family methyltransferase